MNRSRRLTHGILCALAFGLFMPPLAMHAQAIGPLHLGDTLPDISGQNLSDSPVLLSTVVAGKVTIVVFSFSRSGGKDTQLWNKSLLRDFGSNGSVALSTVIMLESAPRLLRGVIVSRLKNDTPPSLQTGTIVSYRDEELWKQRLRVADDAHAYLILLRRDGRLFWMNSVAFDDAEYKRLKTKIQEQL